MKLKTAKYVLAAICVLAVLLILLCSFTKQALWGYFGIALAFIGVIFWMIFGRCPYCGRYLGRALGHYCPRCGEKLD